MSTRPTEQDQSRTRLGRPAATPAPVVSTSSAPETQSPGFLGRTRRWLEGIMSEIRKVTWPTRTETRNLTIVVIGISVAVGSILGLVDLLLSAITRVLTTGTF